MEKLGFVTALSAQTTEVSDATRKKEFVDITVSFRTSPNSPVQQMTLRLPPALFDLTLHHLVQLQATRQGLRGKPDQPAH
jgi:hypothetical protein